MGEVWGDFHFAPNRPEGAGPFEARCRGRICVSAGIRIETGSEYVIPVSGWLKLVILDK